MVLGTYYGAQVESIISVLPEEERPVEEPEFSPRTLNTSEKIEVFKIQPRKFKEWKRSAELRRDVRMTLLNRCTQQSN